MKPLTVGMTYDLRDDYLALGFTEEETAEFDRLDTIQAIDDTLRSLGYHPVRIGHVKHLVARLAAGERWDLVFNIAEGVRGVAREAQVPALLDAYDVPYTFSDPMVLAVTLHKGMTKRIVRDLGLPTADFCVVETEEEIARVNVGFPAFCKPVAEGTGKGITAASKVHSSTELRQVCAHLLTVYAQPVLVEEFLSGREVTVGITGTGPAAQSVGVMEICLQAGAEMEVYSYHNKEHYEKLVSYELVEGALEREAVDLALAAWRGLGCRDGGRIDLRADGAGRLQFLEVNPLAGLHPIRSDLPILAAKNGVPYRELMRRIMDSALRRTNLPAGCSCADPMAATTAVL